MTDPPARVGKAEPGTSGYGKAITRRGKDGKAIPFRDVARPGLRTAKPESGGMGGRGACRRLSPSPRTT